MVSDTLFHAVEEIRGYLSDDAFGYEGEIRAEIEEVVERMDRLRAKLDRSPSLDEEGPRIEMPWERR